MPAEHNIFLSLLILSAGIVLLVKGADTLVDSGSAIARRFSISPLVIGMTIIAMGTSAPELAASVAAGLRGFGNTAIGNVYGSNIANLALVGGVSAVFCPLAVSSRLVKREMAAMLASIAMLFILIHFDAMVSRWDGVLLVLIFGLLVFLAVRFEVISRQSRPPSVLTKAEKGQKSLRLQFILLFVGLAGLVFGADLSVRAGVSLGRMAGFSEAVIGLTIIAVGTSLPELMTSVVASIKKEHEISVGNLVGSNIFNTLLVVGTAGIVRPIHVEPRLMSTDFWIMFSVSAIFWLVCAKCKKITRIFGAGLFIFYILYIAWLIISGSAG